MSPAWTNVLQLEFCLHRHICLQRPKREDAHVVWWGLCVRAYPEFSSRSVVRGSQLEHWLSGALEGLHLTPLLESVEHFRLDLQDLFWFRRISHVWICISGSRTSGCIKMKVPKVSARSSCLTLSTRTWTRTGSERRATDRPPGWSVCWTACCWGIWPGTCGSLTPRGSTATAGWTPVGIITRAFSVPRTLTRRTPPCAAAPARCATAALPRRRGWIRAAAPTTGRWTTPSSQRVSSEWEQVLESSLELVPHREVSLRKTGWKNNFFPL